LRRLQALADAAARSSGMCPWTRPSPGPASTPRAPERETVAVALAGGAGARQLQRPHHSLSRSTPLNALMAVALPELPVPQAIGVDDLALRRGHSYATAVIDAVTHRRVDVRPRSRMK
jgi:hypothetical protein